MAKKDKLVMTGTYDGCTTTKQGVSTIKFKFPYSEITNYIKCFYYLNVDLRLLERVGNDKKEIGNVRLKTIRCDREGQAVISFEGEDLDLADIGMLVEKNVVVCIIPIEAS